MRHSESSLVTDIRNSGSTKAFIDPVQVQAIGAFLLRYGLVFVLALWGSAKWTQAEAESIQPLVAHNPLMSWIYKLMSVQHGSELIVGAELGFATLIALRRWSPRASAAGSAGHAGIPGERYLLAGLISARTGQKMALRSLPPISTKLPLTPMLSIWSFACTR